MEPIDGDGIIGFGAGWTSSTSNSTPFYQSLCTKGPISDCRFGLEVATDGTGTLTFGGVPPKYGSLSTAPTFYRPSPDNSTDLNYEWFLSGDVAIGGLTILSDIGMILDSGSPGISG